MNHLVTLLVGIIFGFGLALAGMTEPQIVLGFLDVAGDWNASLLFVLGGAVSVTVLAFRFVIKLPKPVFASEFRLSELRSIDTPLVIGSALFGMGWGISGYCPGPAVALFAAPNSELWIFIPALVLGYAIHHFLLRPRLQKDDAQDSMCG
ncbi:MAG: DUF6691 family protein [Gallionella sp.]